MKLLFRSGIEKNPGPGGQSDDPSLAPASLASPPSKHTTVTAGIAAAFQAGGHKRRRGRPKSAGGETLDTENNLEGNHSCKCGKIFTRRRNFMQHMQRCQPLTTRTVTTESTKRRKLEPKTPTVPQANSSSEPPANSSSEPTGPVYTQDKEALKLLMTCKCMMILGVKELSLISEKQTLVHHENRRIGTLGRP